MDGLPEEILTEILLRAPARSLARLKWTNKKWYAIISHPTFVKLHLERSRKGPASRKILKVENDYHHGTPVKFAFVDSEKIACESRVHVPTSSPLPIVRVSIKGTCDGLVCLDLVADCGDNCCETHHDMICLWNPSTREFRELPNLHNFCSAPYTRWPAFGVGLGYDGVADDYKVVALVSRIVNRPGTTMVQVWARKTSTWKRVSSTPKIGYICGPTFYLKGAVHWLARRETGGDPVFSHADVILSYGFAKEEFQELPMPKDFPGLDSPAIGTLDGCLCVYTGFALTSHGQIEAWIMKEYGVETSWIQVFNIFTKAIPGPLSGLVQLLTLRNGKILLAHGCNFIQAPFKTGHGFPDVPVLATSWLCVYGESLVSPYSCHDGCKLEEAVTNSPSCTGSRTLGR